MDFHGYFPPQISQILFEKTSVKICVICGLKKSVSIRGQTQYSRFGTEKTAYQTLGVNLFVQKTKCHNQKPCENDSFRSFIIGTTSWGENLYFHSHLSELTHANFLFCLNCVILTIIRKITQFRK